MRRETGILLAAIILAAYGHSIAPLTGASAWKLPLAFACGWSLSLAILVPLSQRPARVAMADGGAVLIAGTAPLAPLALCNWVAPLPAMNSAGLAVAAALIYGVMFLRLRQAWNAFVWFAVFASSGLLVWRIA